jgi:hypothetical protein
MDRTELALVVAGALLLAFLLGWLMRGIFRGLDARGLRDARAVADLAERLHRAEENALRLQTIERELAGELAETREELARSHRERDAALAEMERIRAAYRAAVGPRS